MHWTDRKKKPRLSAYLQTIGRPELRDIFTTALFGDLERAREQGKMSYAKYIESELRSLGTGDYCEFDTGNDPNFRN